MKINSCVNTVTIMNFVRREQKSNKTVKPTENDSKKENKNSNRKWSA